LSPNVNSFSNSELHGFNEIVDNFLCIFDSWSFIHWCPGNERSYVI